MKVLELQFPTYWLHKTHLLETPASESFLELCGWGFLYPLVSMPHWAFIIIQARLQYLSLKVATPSVLSWPLASEPCYG